LQNTTILITGGTGSWGQALVHRLLELEPKEIRIFSRNESLQEEMTTQSFVDTIMQLYDNRYSYRNTMIQHENGGGADKVMDLIRKASIRDLGITMENSS